jgi:hypothetical protein
MKRKGLYKTLFLVICVLLVIGVSSDVYAATDVFTKLSTKTRDFAKGLRNLAYCISGFGVIMFTFLAICGKINFKHLGYIFMCLFFLSGVGALITYVSDYKGEDGNLTFNDTYTKALSSEGTIRNSSL